MFAVLLIITSIIFAALTWRDLKLGIYLILFALPTYLLRFSIGPFPTTLLEILVVIVIMRWLFVYAMSNTTKQSLMSLGLLPACRQAWRSARKDRWMLPIALLLTAAVIGVIVSPNHLAAFGILKAYFVEPILFYLVVKSKLTLRDLPNALKALGYSAIVVSVFGIIQFLTGLGLPAPWDIERRIVSLYDFPNAVGLYLGPIVTLAIMGLCENSSSARLRSNPSLETASPTAFARKDNIIWLVVAILGTIAIILAQTEAALVAIPAALLIISFFHPRLRLLTIPIAIMCLVIAMMIVPVRQKLLLQDYSGEVRRVQWSETIEMLKDHPLFGAGLSGYPTVFAPYHQADWIEIFQYPHNIVLNIWSELGILGLLAFALIAMQVLRSSLLPFKEGAVVVCAVVAPLLEMTIHGLVDVPYFKNDLALMTWALLAMLVISSRLDQSKEN